MMADVRLTCCARLLARALILVGHAAWLMGEDGGVMGRGMLRASAFFPVKPRTVALFVRVAGL